MFIKRNGWLLLDSNFLEHSYLIISKTFHKMENLGRKDSGYILTPETIWKGAKKCHPSSIDLSIASSSAYDRIANPRL